LRRAYDYWQNQPGCYQTHTKDYNILSTLSASFTYPHASNPCFNLTLAMNTSSYKLLIAITNVFSAFPRMTSHVLSSHRPDTPPSHQPLSVSAPTTTQPLSFYYPPLCMSPKPTTPYTHYPPFQQMLKHKSTTPRQITQNYNTTQNKHTKTSTPVQLERRSNCKRKPKHKASISVSTSTCAST